MLARGEWRAPRRRQTHRREAQTRGCEAQTRGCERPRLLLGWGRALRGAACPWTGPSPPVMRVFGSVFFRPEVTGAGSHRKETVVSVHPLPHRPSLTNLRKQAKALLAAWRACEAQ